MLNDRMVPHPRNSSWMVLQNETHLPQYPRKVIDHIAHTNFTVDIATPIDGPAMIKITALPPEAKKSNLRAHLRAVILGVLSEVYFDGKKVVMLFRKNCRLHRRATGPGARRTGTS